MKFLSTTRRELMSAAAAGVAASTVLGAAWAADSAAIVETASGKLQGLSGDGIVTFKGIPYAADTGGRNRFMAPQPVANWTGVCEALKFGDRCAGSGGGGPPGANAASGAGPTYSENCCVLNVYTPSLSANARRPVMFWIHGGGFNRGNGEVDGTNLAKFGDVVVVSVNHRLSVFGYVSLAHVSPDFADSSSAGQLDLIAALNWVKTNISRFGGDPQNVTIFGQSGGGAKVMALGVMPAAQGLYRRSINMSGPGAAGMRLPSASAPISDEMMKVLGIDKKDSRKLQDVPADQVDAAIEKALAVIHDDNQVRPVVDGRNIRYAPMSPEGMAMLAAIPTIMSSARDEFTVPRTPVNLSLTMDQLRERVKAQYGFDDAKANAAIEGYRKDNPQRTPMEILGVVGSYGRNRGAMDVATEAVSKIRGARLYRLDFNFVTDPARGAGHGSDVPYAFGNLAGGRNPVTGPGPAAVAEAMMSTYVAFARTGDPNNAKIPEWKPYDTATRRVLVMENPPRVVSDFRGGDRVTSASLPPLQPYQVNDGPLGGPT